MGRLRLGFLVLVLCSSPALSDEFEMDMLETENLRLLYFDPLTTYLTPHVARSFENSMSFQQKIFGWTPYEKTTVMLKDFIDYGNAAALSSPRNLLWIDVAPLNHTFETFPALERMYMLMNHELVHVATGDAWNSRDRRWRKFFGGKPPSTGVHPESILYAYLTAPRNAAPRWYFEGSAVFMETWMSGGIGRAQGAFDEMVFRARVRDGAHFYSNLGIVSEGTAIDFQTMTNAYLYGTRFMSYLAHEYGPEEVIRWLSRDEDSQRYYAHQFRHVFGQPLEVAWDEWIGFEHAFQRANLDRVRQHPITPLQPLSREPLGSVSRAFVDASSDRLIGGFYFPGVVAHIGALSLADGSTTRLSDIKGPMKYRVTATAWDPVSNTLFYTADNLAMRDLMALNVRTGEARMLLRDARIGDLAFNPADRSLWGLRHLNGYVTLVRMAPPYESWNQVHTWPYGEVLSDLDISPDGRLLAATMEEVSGRQFLRLFRLEDLRDGFTVPLTQFDFGRAIPEGFVFSPDGRYLYGSSYYTGVSNIYRYEVASGDIEAVSNAETGLFRPIPLDDGSLIVFEYTGQGLVPSRMDPRPLEDLSAITFLGNEIARKHPVVREWAVGSPARIDLDSLITHRGRYNPRRELEFESAYPVLEGYRDSVALGYSMTWEDPMLFNSLRADLSWSLDGSLPDSERLHADIECQKLGWRFRYWHNDADFYDLFGPTERSRKGDAVIAGYERALVFDDPRRLDLETELAWFTGLDTLPGNQNVETRFEDLLSGRVELRYTHTEKSLAAVDHEKGLRWNVAAWVDHANGDTVPRLSAGLDFGFALPWKHSSVWLYNAAGVADGDRDNPLANWYFGAFGNNYVDDRDVKRYREYHSFPGFEIDEISGQNFVKSVLEWNLPPLRFRRVGTPALYLQHLRPAVFAGALVTDPGHGRLEEFYTSIGFQLDLKFTVVHRLPMTLSLGFARGFVDGSKADDEIMVSLKIL
ncbi:hypothetical protein [Elongatibacter sediminis]|uniref:Bacterial surface antigen (D15) domain-containing protein n=1 Tax=Elongatibacter sediminis TaxID=3119006 RepID=A0AAW9RGU0_9GAMM